MAEKMDGLNRGVHLAISWDAVTPCAILTGRV